MSDTLPKTIDAWKKAARRNDIGHTQSLTAGAALASGSKFKFEHFLRLRVLYVMGQPGSTIAESPGFPQERHAEVKIILKENPDASFLKSFLQGRAAIASLWTVEKAKKCGVFVAALEHLHLIAKRGVNFMNNREDTSDLKVVLSPARTRNVTSLPRKDASPTPESRQSYPESSLLNDFNEDFDMSSLTLESLEEDVSAPNSDLRQAIDSFDRSAFSPGDEQTVNAALVTLIMALSWLLGHTGRVHHDRAMFSIPKDAETYLYSACVDGLIMHLKEDKCNAFMEVKRDFRSRNPFVRRQIAAQMAAFIFEQDVRLTEKETEKVSKGKGKKAKAKAQEHGDSGNQEQFRKWMVSQDGYYAYINIAYYNRQYVEYLSNIEPSAADDCFMEMKEYGPFDLRIWSGDGLGKFLTYVGALMLGSVGS